MQAVIWPAHRQPDDGKNRLKAEPEVEGNAKMRQIRTRMRERLRSMAIGPIGQI